MRQYDIHIISILLCKVSYYLQNHQKFREIFNERVTMFAPYFGPRELTLAEIRCKHSDSCNQGAVTCTAFLPSPVPHSCLLPYCIPAYAFVTFLLLPCVTFVTYLV